MNNILQICKFDPALFDAIKPSFADLPDYQHDDGQYRRRRYSKARAKLDVLQEGGAIRPSEGNVFHQSEKFNKHQGGVARAFENIEPEIMNSEAMRQLTMALFDACKLDDDHEFEVHQFRIICSHGATQVAPEGWHQDGFDHVAIVGVHRENVIGGEIILSASKTEPPFFTAILECGTMVILKDNFLWHNARTAQAIDDDKPAWIDAMVLTVRLNAD